MATEIFANQPATTVTSLNGGSPAPTSGTAQTWTVASSSGWPAASNAASPPTQFHIADTAAGYTTELITVTNVSGTTWSVTRGAESTTPVTHAGGFTVAQVVSAGALAAFAQLDGTAADILPDGAQNAGANGKAADSGHVHPDMFGGYLSMGTAIGQTMPLICASTQGAAASTGTLIMLRTEVPVGGTTTAANFWITTAGNTLANVYVAAVNTSGTIVAQTANRVADAALTTTGALWSPPWSSSYIAAAGIYYTAILIGSATTAPVFRSGGGLNATSINLGTSVASGTIRVATYSSGLSALPGSPLTMSSMVAAADAKWCAWT